MAASRKWETADTRARVGSVYGRGRTDTRDERGGREERRQNKDPKVARRENIVNLAEGYLAHETEREKLGAFAVLKKAFQDLPEEGEDQHILTFQSNMTLRYPDDHNYALLRVLVIARQYAINDRQDEKSAREAASDRCRAVAAFVRLCGEETVGIKQSIEDIFRDHGVIPEDAHEGFKPYCAKATVPKILDALKAEGQFVIHNRFKNNLPDHWLPKLPATKEQVAEGADQIAAALEASTQKSE